MNITQSQYNVSNQKTQDLNVIIQLLNSNFQVLDEIQGVAISGSISISNGSGVRRSCNISIHPKDSSFEIKEDGKIWLNKYLKIIVEIKDIKTGTYIPTNMGIYVMTNPSQFYDSVSNTINIEGLDLMATLNGYVKGNLKGYNYTIKAGENVRAAIIAILQLNGLNKYSVINIEQDVPNDIIVDNKGSYFDLLKQLCEILPHYQMYFDVDGTFIFNEIPLNSNETVVATNELFENKIISWNKKTHFGEIKNMIIVIGKTHEVDNFANDTVVNGNILEMELINITSLRDYTKIGFIPSTTLINPQISVNTFGVKNLKITNNNDDIILMKDIYYVMSYREDGDYWEFYGEVEPRYEIKDVINDSPFNVYKLGEIDITLTGGDYDNIYTTDLARQRAEWELYRRTRLQETVDLELVPIYWLNDTNKIIELKLPNKQNEEELSQYVINEISFDLSVEATQSINISKYYPFYTTNPEVVSGRYIEGVLNETIVKQNFESIDDMKQYLYQHRIDFTSIIKVVNTEEDLNLDTSFMFNEFKNVEIIDLSNFNMANNRSMRGMFQNCNNVHTIILPDLSEQNLNDIRFCFYGCYNLLDIDLSSINTSSVDNFRAMFFACHKLIADLSYLSSNKVVDLSAFAWGLQSIKTLDLSNMVIDSNTNVEDMLHETGNVVNAYARDEFSRDLLNSLPSKPNTYEFVVK